jgi:chemotaxis protein methyltransferase CheR
MSEPLKIDPVEFRIIRDYIEKNCGILVAEEKTYLIEARLTTLMKELKCRSFVELHSNAITDKSNSIRDRIIDAMTTNETFWFRDQFPFSILEKNVFPEIEKSFADNRKKKVRIWSSTCSTGQEPYSIALTIYEFCRNHFNVRPEHFEILATDISSIVLNTAQSGRYDDQSMSRGMPEEIRNRYFRYENHTWILDDRVKNLVSFSKHNLRDRYTLFDKFDIIFCRNVLIYFSDIFKKDILHRCALQLLQGGYLFTGTSESLINYSNEFEMLKYQKGLYYKVKNVF